MFLKVVLAGHNFKNYSVSMGQTLKPLGLRVCSLRLLRQAAVDMPSQRLVSLDDEEAS